MKTLSLIAVALMLSGCGWFGRTDAYLTGYSKACVDGVLYLQFASGVTVAYDRNGKVRTCE